MVLMILSWLSRQRLLWNRITPRDIEVATGWVSQPVPDESHNAYQQEQSCGN
jgi:hypothetical protein